MVAILLGDHTVNVQSHVEEDSKHVNELAPIHLHQMVDEIVVDWDQVPPAENAMRRRVEVRFRCNISFFI